MTQLLSKREAAAVLGVSPFSMNRIMRELPFVRVSPRRVVFDVRDIEGYIERKKVQPRTRQGGGE